MADCLSCGSHLVQNCSLKTLLFARNFYADQICGNCARKFERIEPTHACPECYRAQTDGQVCQDCQRYRALGVDKAHNVSLFTYNQAMHDYMQQYKRHGDYRIRALFSGSLRRTLQFYRRDYLLVPIPTSQAHFAQRQFDPVLGLYDQLCPLTPLLVKNGREWHQSTLERKERIKAPQTFACPTTDWSAYKQNKILILDDIYTTGTTLLRATDALRASHFQGEIKSLTLAR
ncbi:ComF family protein [Lapidilactobacillus mulanensis]|uniref:ComF family protein n=1 Tax=Lapidilactobacillus mulanensis TaxID=2485999 RepID=A0ABW4DNQ8_9LACO|nr:phosphoribosyltransferase family protein [Lapidilactobacillus mulanensis]